MRRACLHNLEFVPLHDNVVFVYFVGRIYTERADGDVSYKRWSAPRALSGWWGFHRLTSIFFEGMVPDRDLLILSKQDSLEEEPKFLFFI